MKKYTVTILAAAMLFSLTACGGQQNEETGNDNSQSQDNTSRYTATIYADFSCSSVNPEEEGLIKTKEVQLSEEPEATDYAAQLSEWTGLDFTLSDVKEEGTVLYVDWTADSTLIAGLNDREQKEDFHFYDQDSLRWFMMDSLRLTLTESGGASDVYYTMNGGQELVLDELNPVNAFTTDTPYMGSAFYFSHADLRGDEDDIVSNDNDQNQDDGGSTDSSQSQDDGGSTDNTDDVNWTPPHGVFMSGYRFTGLTPEESNEDFHGGYYYSDRTEDGLTLIVNCGFENGYYTPEECAKIICGEEPKEMDARDTSYWSYAGHYVTWRTSGNEDTRQWDGLLVYTDAYTYFYGFDTTADNAAEMQDVWYEVLDQVELVFPDEE